MPLTNQQMGQIEQIYLERRNRAQDEAAARRRRIEAAVPEFSRLEREQAELRGQLIEARRAGSVRSGGTSTCWATCRRARSA